MKSGEDITLKNGNIRQSGRTTGNAGLKALHAFGEERCRTHYEFLDRLASEGDKECAMFIVDRVIPKAKGVRTIQIDLPELDTIENIHKAEKIVVGHISRGELTLEEGDKLINIIKNSRETIHTTEVIAKIAALEKKMEDGRPAN